MCWRCTFCVVNPAELQAEVEELHSVESEPLQSEIKVNDSAVAIDILKSEFTALDEILSTESLSASTTNGDQDSGSQRQKEVMPC